jgi:hypothetical protein
LQWTAHPRDYAPGAAPIARLPDETGPSGKEARFLLDRLLLISFAGCLNQHERDVTA